MVWPGGLNFRVRDGERVEPLRHDTGSFLQYDVAIRTDIKGLGSLFFLVTMDDLTRGVENISNEIPKISRPSSSFQWDSRRRVAIAKVQGDSWLIPSSLSLYYG